MRSPPQLVSISQTDPSLTNAAIVHYTVTFSEAVGGVDASQFSLITSAGVSGATITGVTEVPGSGGAQYTVTVDTGSGDGSVALQFDGNDLADAAGNRLVGNPLSVLSPASDIAVTGSHGGVTAADVDNDGLQDIIVATSGGLTAVLLGNGDGTLAPPVFYNSGPNSAFVAAGDLDGDQDVDLVVTNYGFGVNTISVLRGNGDGTFQAPVTYDAGQTPFVVRLADVDATGRSMPSSVTTPTVMDSQSSKATETGRSRVRSTMRALEIRLGLRLPTSMGTKSATLRS